MTREEAVSILKRTYYTAHDTPHIGIDEGREACRMGVDALQQLAAFPPEPDYRALLVEAADELWALGKEGLTIDEELAGDLRTFAARIRAALEGR